MFRAMRRSRQAMPQEECAAVLERGSHGVLALAVKYAPEDSVEHRERYIQQDWASVCLLEMAIDHLSGKEERELARERRWEQGVDCAGC